MSLTGRTAVVTGGGRGIGRAIARRLAQDGAKVALWDLADHEGVADELKAQGAQAIFVPVDVTNADSISQGVEATIANLGSIDILVNNAGITQDSLLMRMDEGQWDAVLNVNLKGAYLCSKAVLRPMLKARYGRIINIASVVGLMGNAGQTNYSASKAGLIGFTKSLAREVASRGITVNAVAPGFIASEMTDALSDKQKEVLQGQIPMGEIGTPEDVANGVWFLSTDASRYITGQVLNINGGLLMV
ncbi:MAG: 3-oxoacyl-[acyl-carrier-protein] reductase [Firmicutes bacterium]|nr:3-oxoacyl-[acyl-carrier-protein] reductase [Bacillota bacterium]